MPVAMTYEELKKYDRTTVRYRGTEGVLYLFKNNAFFLNNVLSGATPRDGGLWKKYGYSYSWYIGDRLYNDIIHCIDYSKLEGILCS